MENRAADGEPGRVALAISCGDLGADGHEGSGSHVLGWMYRRGSGAAFVQAAGGANGGTELPERRA